MNTTAKLSAAVILVASLAGSGAALAATNPVFHIDNSETASDFTAALGYFNPGDVKALDHARIVTVVRDNSWALDGGSGDRAEQLTAINDDAGNAGPDISRVQKALSDDKIATNILKSHGISVGSVAAIEAGRNGVVTLYVM
jgi:hypothetical protein